MNVGARRSYYTVAGCPPIETLKSLLIGDRAALDQSERPLEKISAVFDKMLGPLIPTNRRSPGCANACSAKHPRQKAGSWCSQAKCNGPNWMKLLPVLGCPGC